MQCKGAVLIADQMTCRLRVTLNSVHKIGVYYRTETLCQRKGFWSNVDAGGLEVYTQHCHLTLQNLYLSMVLD